MHFDNTGHAGILLSMLAALTAHAEVATLVLALFSVVLVVWVIRLEVKLRRLTRGQSGASLERIIRHIQEAQENEEQFRHDTKEALRNLHRRMKNAARGITTIRFDAFPGTGSAGKQSFATALLSETGDGVVFSSLHARESTRMFAKPVSKFTSEHELTDEEKRALEHAREQLSAQ